MIPAFKIIAGNNDITNKVKSRLISLSITDEAGTVSDSCTIVIDDREEDLAIPNKGEELSISIGYKEIGLQSKGKFTVDEISLSGPPSQLTITARGANFKKNFNTRRNFSWHNTTLGEIVKTIAVRSELTAKVDSDLADDIIIHEDQLDESDINFLARLARTRDAVVKPAGNYLLFIGNINPKTVSQNPIPVIPIKRNEHTSWNISLPDRKNYNTVIATWYDKDKALTIEEKAGNGEPIFRVQNPLNNKEEAFKCAQRYLKRFQRRSGDLTLVFPGNPEIIAETPINLIGFKKEIDGLWVVKKVTHTLSNSGYITNIECEPKQE